MSRSTGLLCSTALQTLHTIVFCLISSWHSTENTLLYNKYLFNRFQIDKIDKINCFLLNTSKSEFFHMFYVYKNALEFRKFPVPLHFHLLVNLWTWLTNWLMRLTEVDKWIENFQVPPTSGLVDLLVNLCQPQSALLSTPSTCSSTRISVINDAQKMKGQPPVNLVDPLHLPMSVRCLSTQSTYRTSLTQLSTPSTWFSTWLSTLTTQLSVSSTCTSTSSNLYQPNRTWLSTLSTCL